MLRVGTARIDITPDSGVELCGFANRQQPSDHIFDPLFVRVVYLAANDIEILFINLDLIGVEYSFAQKIKTELNKRYNIPESHIQVFATHTHSGPGTIQLNYCGDYNSEYVDRLEGKIFLACSRAMENMDSCTAEYRSFDLKLGVNRLSGGKAPLTLKILAFKNAAEEYKGLLVNYPMHPVCMKGRGISADYPGVVRRKLSEKLNGNPEILFGLGAAGDIDPPKVGVDYEQMEEWGSEISDGVLHTIRREAILLNGKINLRENLLEIPLQNMSEKEIDIYADKYFNDKYWNKEFGEVFQNAVVKWSKDMKELAARGEADKKVIKIVELKIGILSLIYVNAELFSEFEKILNQRTSSPFIVITCANGLEGYFPDKNQYEKGGYEIETSLFFYNSFIPVKGSLEMLAQLPLT